MEENNEVTSSNLNETIPAKTNTEVKTMSEVTLKDKMSELNVIVKALDGLVKKNPELQAGITVNVSYGLGTYASITRDGDDLKLETLSG